MSRDLGGCPEYDDRLIDLVVDGAPDADLEQHLEVCDRCRTASERYAATAAALGAALGRPQAVRSGPRSLRWWLLAAAAAVVASVLWFRQESGPRFDVHTAEDAEVEFGEHHEFVRLVRGTARFVVDRGPLRVETPLGVARCEGGDFSLQVDREGAMDAMDAKHAALAVTVTVTAGVVWWVADGAVGGAEVAVEPGAPFVERATAPLVSDATGTAPLEAPGSALVDEPRAPLAGEPEASGAADHGADTDVDAEAGFEIVGRVVDGETGRPVAGAVVSLGSRDRRRGNFVASATSGEDGTFHGASRGSSAFSMVDRPGAFAYGTFLSVELEGYAPVFEAPWQRFEAGDPLEASEPVDLGSLRVFPGVEVRGRVVRSDGAPFPDAVLLLAENSASVAGFAPALGLRVGRSDADGKFVLDRRVAPPARFDTKLLFAGSSEGLGWTVLDVLAEKRELQGVEIRIGDFGRLQVQVLDGERRPIEGANVLVEPRFAPLVPELPDRGHDHMIWLGPHPEIAHLFSATTDAEGRVRLERLPAPAPGGLYDVVATADGYARGWQDDLGVPPSRDTRVTLVLEPYRPRAIAGTVTSPDGAPIAGAKVETYAPTGTVSAATDETGAYRLEGMDPSVEAAWFSVGAEGYVPFRRQVAIAAGGDVEGLGFVLQPPLPIAGRVVDELGRPVAGARPRLHREREFRAFRGEQGRTGEDGTFRFDDATAGEWNLHVGAPEPVTDWSPTFVIRKVDGGDEAVEVVLHRARHAGSRVVAEIVDAETGEPLDPAAASIGPVGRWPEGARRGLPAVTRGAGRAVAEIVDPGSWRIWVRVAGRATAYADFTVEPGEREVPVTVRVGRRGVLTGRVVFDERVPHPAGRPVEIEAQVETSAVPWGDDWSSGDASVIKTTLPVAPDGSFRLENATPGSWWITIRSGGLLGNARAEVPSGGEGRAELRPIVGARLVFRTNDVAPEGGMRVDLRAREGNGDSDTYFRNVTVPEGRALEYEATLWPGAVHWRLAFQDAGEPHGSTSEGIAFEQEGELVVAPGDEIAVPVPLVLRD